MTRRELGRLLQRLGGHGGVFSTAFTVVADIFPSAERGKYQGLFGAVWGISSVVGSWHILGVFGLGAAGVALLVLVESKAAEPIPRRSSPSPITSGFHRR